MTATILTDRTDAAITLRLNRPDKANALTEEMLVALRDAVREFDGRAMILTGTGRVFSAGADLDAARAGLATSPLWEELSGAIAAQRAFTIAALNGTCAGGAMGMALACDCRIAAPHATVFYPVMRLGFLPQPSDPVRLTALVGPARAKLLLLGGAKLDAREAQAVGLIDAIATDPAQHAESLTQDARKATTDHVYNIKKMVG